MDLTPEEQQQLILELNPHLAKGREWDANWQQLKREQEQPKPSVDWSRTVKTQTPQVFDFETHCAFNYRRSDGAHWHTELRNLQQPPGFTEQQHRFVDSLNTLLALQHLEGFEWHTPVTEQGAYDNRYQLAKRKHTWYCLMGDILYKESTRRYREDRGYTEIRFSTRNTPTTTQQQLDLTLDELIGEQQCK